MGTQTRQSKAFGNVFPDGRTVAASSNVFPSDEGRRVLCNGVITLTLTDNHPANTQIRFQNIAASTVTFAPDTGITIQSTGLTMVAIHEVVIAEYKGGDVWLLYGDLT